MSGEVGGLLLKQVNYVGFQEALFEIIQIIVCKKETIFEDR